MPPTVPCPRLESLVGAGRSSVPELLRAQAAAAPAAPFLRFDDRVWSYGNALLEVERFAGFLHGRGLAGERVASYLTNRPEAVWAWFGTQLAGGTYVPLNRSHRGPLLADMLRRSGATALVLDPDAVDDVLPLFDAPTLVVPGGVDDGRALPYAAVEAATPWGGVSPEPGDVGMVMYTSGSTGRSKAVRIPHNQHARGGAHMAERFDLRPDDVWHGWAPLYHVIGQLYVVVASLVAGGSVALRPRFTRSRFWEDVHASRATVIGALANMMRLVWALPDTPASRDNPARLAFINGAFGDLQRPFEERFGVQVADCYGLTEAEPVTLPVPGRDPAGSQGSASGDFEVAILGADDAPLPAGAAGEIAVRPRVPDVMFRGYEHDDARTVEAWRNLWFHTGDIGRLDTDGILHFTERRPHGIRRNGENVSAFELEAIVQACPGVVAAAAVAIPDRPGEDEIKVAVVADPEAGLTAARIHAWCAEHAARFMVPRYVELLERLPTLAVGKVDKARLLEVDGGVWDAQAQEATTDG